MARAGRTSERLDMRRTSLGAAHPNVAAADVALSAVEAALGDTDDAATRALSGERVGLAHLRLLSAACLNVRLSSMPPHVQKGSTRALSPAPG